MCELSYYQKVLETLSGSSRKYQKKSKRSLGTFSNNPRHLSLRFKKGIDHPTVYSVRITGSYRALGVRDDQTIIWFWIGNHDDYDQLLKKW